MSSPSRDPATPTRSNAGPTTPTRPSSGAAPSTPSARPNGSGSGGSGSGGPPSSSGSSDMFVTPYPFAYSSPSRRASGSAAARSPASPSVRASGSASASARPSASSPLRAAASPSARASASLSAARAPASPSARPSSSARSVSASASALAGVSSSAAAPAVAGPSSAAAGPSSAAAGPSSAAAAAGPSSSAAGPSSAAVAGPSSVAAGPSVAPAAPAPAGPPAPGSAPEPTKYCALCFPHIFKAINDNLEAVQLDRAVGLLPFAVDGNGAVENWHECVFRAGQYSSKCARCTRQNNSTCLRTFSWISGHIRDAQRIQELVRGLPRAAVTDDLLRALGVFWWATEEMVKTHRGSGVLPRLVRNAAPNPVHLNAYNAARLQHRGADGFGYLLPADAGYADYMAAMKDIRAALRMDLAAFRSANGGAAALGPVRVVLGRTARAYVF